MIKKDNNILSDKKKQNILGIQILRVFLCFMVVLDHLYSGNKYIYLLYYHIPTFFNISFYFTYNTLISYNIRKIKLRLERLFIPYFIYSIISWIIYNIYFFVLKVKCKHTIKDFIINIIDGHQFNYVLWFQNNLILLTLLFLIIIFIFKNKYLLVLLLLAILAYILQYTGINYYFFKKNFNLLTAATFGRFAEAFPNAFTGFLLSKIDKQINLKKYYKKFLFISTIILIIISKYHTFDNIKTFKYGGIRLNLAGICIFIIFFSLPFENLRNKKIIEIIIKITSYTGGIYFIHRLVGYGYICNHISFIKKRTFAGCIIVYLICYTISAIGAKIFKNNKLKHIFS